MGRIIIIFMCALSLTAMAHAWLEANPDDWQEQYNALTVRFDALSSQLDSLYNGR